MKRIILIYLITILIFVPISVSATIFHNSDTQSLRWTDLSDSIGTVQNGDNYVYYYSMNIQQDGSMIGRATCKEDGGGTYYLLDVIYPSNPGAGCRTQSPSGSYSDTSSGYMTDVGILFVDASNSYECESVTYSHTLIVSTDTYIISGGIGCVESLTLDVWESSAWLNLITENVSGETDYSYNVSYGYDYRITIDSSSHNFTCDGNEIYNYDVCEYYTLNLLDNCANPLINPHTTIFKNMTEVIYEGSDNPIKLLPGTDVELNDYLQIIIDTTDGAVQYNDYVSIIEQDLYHNFVAWNMNIHVVDDSTGSDISDANVVLSQDCSIDLPNTENILTTVTGHAIFAGLSNMDMGVSVTKNNYNTYSKTISVGSIFNCWSTGGSFTVSMNSTTGNSTDNYQNGTHDDSGANGTGEQPLPADHGYGCGVYFKNTDGIITDTINDTDIHVDMYWWVKGSDATLKFQHQIYTHWYTNKEYSVSNNTYDYRRILNTNFTDYTNAYRGYIYNATEDCNSIQRLYVINQTYEAETDYENLTAHCWIKNTLSGNEIDYRSDIKCVIYANSTNSSLLGITAHFMNQSTEVDSIVLNWADFISGSPKWYYIWYPDYEYTSGYNYTLNITGFDSYQLDTDEVWTADVIGNTLTVYVKNNHNAPLAYSTVFVQGWGSSALDSSTDISIKGLSDGNIQYKATKVGYLSSSWSNITLDGSDESVTCILTESTTDSVTGYKLKDSEIKEFFIPLMYMLLIMILLGGFMNAAKK